MFFFHSPSWRWDHRETSPGRGLSTLAIKNGCKEHQSWLAPSTNHPECCDASCRGYRAPKWSLVVRVNQIRHLSASATASAHPRPAAAGGHHSSVMSLWKEVWTCSVWVCALKIRVCTWEEMQRRERDEEEERWARKAKRWDEEADVIFPSSSLQKKFWLLLSALHLSQLHQALYITAGNPIWVPRERWLLYY